MAVTVMMGSMMAMVMVAVMMMVMIIMMAMKAVAVAMMMAPVTVRMALMIGGLRHEINLLLMFGVFDGLFEKVNDMFVIVGVN